MSAQTDKQKRELAERLTLGKQGLLWKIEILYKLETNSTGRHAIVNRTDRELQKIRELLFSIGFMLPIDPGHWRVIPPHQVLDVHLWRQDSFFDVI